MPDNQPEPNYQDILDKYAASLKSTEVPPIPEPPKTPKIGENIQETKPESELLTPVSEEKISETLVQPEPQPELASPEPQPQLEPTSQSEAIIPPLVSPEPTGEGGSIPKENNFFKYLFFFSLFIFLIVLVSVIVSFINSQKSLSNTQNTPTIATSPTVAPATVCQINDQTYPVGQTFTATDGCNTCTCNADLTISCTTNTCTATPTAKLTPTKSATTSAKTTTIPSDLIALVKSTAADEAKTTASKVIIGSTKIIGNYAEVAFNYTTGGGAIYWATKINGLWKIVTENQEPPACTILAPYKFPSDFECNQ